MANENKENELGNWTPPPEPASADSLQRVVGPCRTTNMNCNCIEKIRKELPDISPSGGYDEVDEVLGLLRVARMREQMAEKQCQGLKEQLSELRRLADGMLDDSIKHRVNETKQN